MQAISIPYRCDSADVGFLRNVRRVFSAVVRTAHANAVADGVPLKQNELRDLVKRRFAGGPVDA